MLRVPGWANASALLPISAPPTQKRSRRRREAAAHVCFSARKAGSPQPLPLLFVCQVYARIRRRFFAVGVIVLDVVSVLVPMTRPVEMRMLVRMLVIVFDQCVRMLVDGPICMPVFRVVAHERGVRPDKMPTYASRTARPLAGNSPGRVVLTREGALRYV